MRERLALPITAGMAPVITSGRVVGGVGASGVVLMAEISHGQLGNAVGTSAGSSEC